MLGAGDQDSAVLNLGGIGNLTLIPRDGAVLGFDTGPANALLDSWCQRHHGTPFDAEGAFAASGRVDAALLQALLADPWFALPPPKSTGREQFHLDWVLQAMGSARLDAADVQATLLELTAASVADALLRLQPSTRRVLVCGGGCVTQCYWRAWRRGCRAWWWNPARGTGWTRITWKRWALPGWQPSCWPDAQPICHR